MSPRAWHRRFPGLLAQEVDELAEVGFALEEDLDKTGGDAVFTGELRRGLLRHPARVVYPPAFLEGAQVRVVAPGLPITRHISPEGLLCLDHPVMGELAHLRGREAIARAEELWRLSVEDPEQLRDEEAAAPDPHHQYVRYQPASAILGGEVDLEGCERGVIRVGIASLTPVRGAVVGLRVDVPDRGELALAEADRASAGPLIVTGPWKRVSAPPDGFDAHALWRWAEREHPEIVALAEKLARIRKEVFGKNVPALAGFLYPDEISWRTTGDQWLLLVRPQGHSGEVVRYVRVGARERLLRQPLLKELADKSVAVVGLGALGSSVAALLARAGVGTFFLVDSDILQAGNIVRHDLDLSHVGVDKVSAVADRLRRINPHAKVGRGTGRLGEQSQADDDRLFAEIAGCDLIVNTAANPNGGHYYIAAAGREANRPVVHAWVGPGAWGARVITQRKSSGCPECLARHQGEDRERYPIESGPTEEVLDEGCSDPSFTGAGFDLSAAAAATTRAVAGELLADPESYPPPPDLLTLTMRTTDAAVPSAVGSDLPIHPQCDICRV